MEQPKEMVFVMERIDRGITFFNKNIEFKKADLYLKKFEGLR